ncbi:MAG: dTDP-4-dehydrorhamnose reductase [Candidatus Komeilibacteria bacterium]|nr:dTDP-4-dehydrorhamnose reductase [Candidatus Komeilibacteria bacterium]
MPKLLNNKILIFGSTGQLGSDLIKVFKNDFSVIGVKKSQINLLDYFKIERFVLKEKPRIIINAAAYTKVEQAEIQIEQAFKINALGAYYLAKAAEKCGAIFVHFSTDYVFSGKKKFYTEADQPEPLNIYGWSKFFGEILVRSACQKYYLIRTSALFGNKKSRQKINFVEKILSAAKTSRQIKVVANLITSPTYSLDLAAKVRELLIKKPPFGIYHITNSGYCSWYEFSKMIIELKHLAVKIRPVKNKNKTIKRPRSVILINKNLKKNHFSLLPSWQDALKRYLIIN